MVIYCLFLYNVRTLRYCLYCCTGMSCRWQYSLFIPSVSWQLRTTVQYNIPEPALLVSFFVARSQVRGSGGRRRVHLKVPRPAWIYHGQGFRRPGHGCLGWRPAASDRARGEGAREGESIPQFCTINFEEQATREEDRDRSNTERPEESTSIRQ